MEDKEDLSLSTRSTRSIFVSLIFVSVGVPAIAVLLIFIYLHFTHTEFTRHDWKSVAFSLWWLTLLALVVVVFKERRGIQMNPDDRAEAMNSYESTAIKWERRKAKRLMKRLYALAFLLPLAGITVAVCVLRSLDVALFRREWMILCVCYWSSGLLLLMRYAILSRKEGLVWSSKESASE